MNIVTAQSSVNSYKKIKAQMNNDDAQRPHLLHLLNIRIISLLYYCR